MSDTYRTAGKGLFFVFLGQILCLFSMIPILGAILSIVGLVLHLVGLNTAKPAHPGFQTAFTIAIVSVVVAVISIFLAPLSIVNTVLCLVELYYICNATCALLADKGDHFQSEKGQKIWKLYLRCTIITIVCMVLALIPILGIVALVVAVIAAIFQPSPPKTGGRPPPRVGPRRVF